jgi:hypothetical protein
MTEYRVKCVCLGLRAENGETFELIKNDLIQSVTQFRLKILANLLASTSFYVEPPKQELEYAMNLMLVIKYIQNVSTPIIFTLDNVFSNYIEMSKRRESSWMKGQVHISFNAGDLTEQEYSYFLMGYEEVKHTCISI